MSLKERKWTNFFLFYHLFMHFNPSVFKVNSNITFRKVFSFGSITCRKFPFVKHTVYERILSLNCHTLTSPTHAIYEKENS